MNLEAKICVAGANTLIGAAILHNLARQNYRNVVGPELDAFDLRNSQTVEGFFEHNRPEYIFLAAGKSGGIRANQKYPAELMLDNLLVETHVIHAAHKFGVKKLLYLASSCSYPKHSPQPMREEYLLTGTLESTNEAYAVAKIAGLKLCEAYHQQYGANFIGTIPANAFGPGDDMDIEDAHVIPALLMKMHHAKLTGANRVEVWGTGTPQREFIFADDLASGCVFVMERYDDAQPINLGSGSSFSIRELAELVQQVVGFTGELYFDTSKPDGMPLKMLDSSKLHGLGWRAATPMFDALFATYQWMLKDQTVKTTRTHVR